MEKLPPVVCQPSEGVKLSGEVIKELSTALGQHFEWLSSASDAYLTPQDIDQQSVFQPAIVPGTVSQLINHQESLSTLDHLDHWYRTDFSAEPDASAKTLLRFAGLLTFAEVFLNNECILQSRNAFHEHGVDVSDKIKPNNQLYICFRAIAPALAKKQPRGRFPTRLVNERHLRFVRTPVLGYTPGFASPAKLVGPFRPISLITQRQFLLKTAQINTDLDKDSQGDFTVGVLSLRVSVEDLTQTRYTHGNVILFDAQSNQEISRTALSLHQGLHQDQENWVIEAHVRAENIAAYWPHTHGNPKRYQVIVALQSQQDAVSGHINLGEYGFRHLERVSERSLALKFNGVPMFFRGACWTPMHPMSLQTEATALRQRLQMLCDAGINMLRIPGNMLYESDLFYELCDAMGILIMQDYAFTNFDYPDNDVAFVESVKKEAVGFLAKHGSRANLTLLSGNSEVAQQAAMMGLALDQLGNAIFDDLLKTLSLQYAPQVPYVNSSPSAKGIPFHVGYGTSHYYGVGGYMRSFEDARLFKGRWIAECLAFSHVPEDSSLYQFFENEFIPSHHPRWKDAVPRDVGSGWDFSDITDFYIEKLFGVTPAKLRAIEPQRYLEYCRATTVEVVERTMSIFRADSTEGRAALVWFLHDLKQGAGWGYIDSLGKPKSAFYGLARACQPTTLLFVDEGLEGLALYLANDNAETLACQLEIALMTADGQQFAQQTQPIQLKSRTLERVDVDAFLGRFVDSSYAYRFGARGFVATVAKLTTAQGNVLSQRVYVDAALTQQVHQDVGLSVSVQAMGETSYALTISTEKPAYFVTIDAPNFTLSDNYFHVVPGFATIVALKSDARQTLHGRMRAFNAVKTITIKQ